MKCPHKALSKAAQADYACPLCGICFCLHKHEEREDGWWTKCKHSAWRRCVPDDRAAKTFKEKHHEQEVAS